MEKCSHRERNRVLDCVHNFMNKLPERYPLTTIAVDKLNKQEMFEMPTTSRLSFVSIAFTGYVDVI